MLKLNKHFFRFIFISIAPIAVSIFLINFSLSDSYDLFGTVEGFEKFISLVASAVLASSVSFATLGREERTDELDFFLVLEFSINFLHSLVLAFSVLQVLHAKKLEIGLNLILPSILIYLFLCAQMTKGAVVHKINADIDEDLNDELDISLRSFLVQICLLLLPVFAFVLLPLYSGLNKDNVPIRLFHAVILLSIFILIAFLVLYLLFSFIDLENKNESNGFRHVTTLNGFPKFAAILLGSVFQTSAISLCVSYCMHFYGISTNHPWYIVPFVFLYSITTLYGIFGSGPFTIMAEFVNTLESEVNKNIKSLAGMFLLLKSLLKRMLPKIIKGRAEREEGEIYFVGSREFSTSDFDRTLIDYLNSIPREIDDFKYIQQKSTRHFFSLYYKGSRVGHMRLRKSDGEAELRVGANYEKQNREIKSNLKRLPPGVEFKEDFIDNSGAKREQFRVSFKCKDEAPPIDFLNKIFDLIKRYKN